MGAIHFLKSIQSCRIIIESFDKTQILQPLLDAGFIEVATLYGDNFVFEKNHVK